MRLPYFPSWDNVPVYVELSQNIGRDGEATVLATYTGKCNVIAKAKTVRGKDGQSIALSAQITIRGDIFPDYPIVSGKAVLDGKNCVIFSGEKVRNPDGSVNHTRLELL